MSSTPYFRGTLESVSTRIRCLRSSFLSPHLLGVLVVLWGFGVTNATAADQTQQAQSSNPAAASAPVVVTRGLNHLGLTVRDLEASVAFFVDVLGWRVVGGYPDYPSQFVTDGHIFVTLWQANDPQAAVAFDRKNNIGLHHLALTVVSLEALHELHSRMLTAPGVEIEFAPELNGDGPTVHMMIAEPSGNRIEFAHTPGR